MVEKPEQGHDAQGTIGVKPNEAEARSSKGIWRPQSGEGRVCIKQSGPQKARGPTQLCALGGKDKTTPSSVLWQWGHRHQDLPLTGSQGICSAPFKSDTPGWGAVLGGQQKDHHLQWQLLGGQLLKRGEPGFRNVVASTPPALMPRPPAGSVFTRR